MSDFFLALTVTNAPIPLSSSEKKVYLSSIMDVFNGEIIAYSLSQSPTTSFTNLALDEALQTVQAVKDDKGGEK